MEMMEKQITNVIETSSAFVKANSNLLEKPTRSSRELEKRTKLTETSLTSEDTSSRVLVEQPT